LAALVAGRVEVAEAVEEKGKAQAVGKEGMFQVERVVEFGEWALAVEMVLALQWAV